MSDNSRIVVICGPTAVGKTKLSIDLALAFNGEIVSSDSMQIYKYMDIGSAKPTKEELAKVAHHLVDCVDPREEYTVARYKVDSQREIDDIIKRGKLPFVVGGTGLYINSIIYDMDFAADPLCDPKLREELTNLLEKKGKDYLYQILVELSPETAERIHPNNCKKVIRAIESCKMGRCIKDFSKDLRKNPKYDPLIICLTRNREELYERINERVDNLVEKGLIQEVEALLEKGLSKEYNSMQGIGYKEIISYLEGEISKEEAIDIVKKNSRHYAKRQFTWFKRYKDIRYFDLSNRSEDDVLEEIKLWLKREL